MGEPIATVGDLAGMCGHDGSDWIKALIDAAGHLQIDIVDSGGADLKDVLDKLTDILTELNAKLETADLDLDASGRLSANQHHYDGAAWRKSNLVWGYYDRWVERTQNLDAVAGGNALYFTEVPSGEVWVANYIAAMNENTNPSKVWFGVDVSGTLYTLLDADGPGAIRYLYTPANLVLKAGDKLFVYFWGCTAGDNIYGHANGYKMKVDM